jgi:hypothetical protein
VLLSLDNDLKPRIPVTHYERIGEAVKYYRNLGYEYVDVPWIVDRSIVEMTTKVTPIWLSVPGRGYKDLIGSGEQGFLAIWDKLSEGKRYVTCTPCFRNEPVYDESRQLGFMKVELFAKSTDDWRQFCNDASGFVRKQGVDHRLVQTILGYDIEVNGIEVGSYGGRRVGDKVWSYGTGLAEPRFTYALTNLTDAVKEERILKLIRGQKQLSWLTAEGILRNANWDYNTALTKVK